MLKDVVFSIILITEELMSLIIKKSSQIIIDNIYYSLFQIKMETNIALPQMEKSTRIYPVILLTLH